MQWEFVQLRTARTTCSLSDRYSTNFLYLPDLLVWCSDKENALAIGPIYVFDEATNSWSKRSIFQSLYGKTFSLFHHNNGSIIYAGLYKAVDLRKWSPDGLSLYNMTSDRGEGMRHMVLRITFQPFFIHKLFSVRVCSGRVYYH